MNDMKDARDLRRDLRRAASLLEPSLLSNGISQIPVEVYQCPLSMREKPEGFREGYDKESVPGYVFLVPPTYRKNANAQKGYS